MSNIVIAPEKVEPSTHTKEQLVRRFNTFLEGMIDELIEPKFSKNAITILEKRYLLKDDDLNIIETPKELLIRVAKLVALEELNIENPTESTVDKALDFFKNIYTQMAELKFLPNSPALMNAGTPVNQLHACFVLPIQDSMDSIFESLSNMALVQKSGGGTGFDFSKLRAKNSVVGATKGTASGPVSFMRIFNEATEQIKQGGKRRGASIALLDISHPDIEEFICCKDEDGVLNNFNISVAITEEFMQNVLNDGAHQLIDPHTKEVVKEVSAKNLFDKLVEHAWRYGDPGILFVDEVNVHNPVPKYRITATNPCGEVNLQDGESCNLASINLSKFLHYGSVQWEDLGLTVELAVKYLDNSIDASTYPLQLIDSTSKSNRKLGLGIMGLADVLFKLKLPYDSEEGREFASEIMEFINETARSKSLSLGREKGTFPNIDISIYKDTPMRNATRTTIAPTGTLSMLAECSSGMEPMFSLAYVKKVMDGTEFVYMNKYLEEALVDVDLGNENVELIKSELSKCGILSLLPEDIKAIIPTWIHEVFVCAPEISPKDHVLMQATLQKHVDNSISKTVNMPNSATVQDVYDVYMEAYLNKCKGVTIYRDGSKQDQVLYVGSKTYDQKTTEEVVEIKTKDRPDILEGFTTKIKTGLGTLYLTVNEIDDKPFEVFATIGKSGNSTMAKAEAIGRLVSLSLRSGVGVDEIVNQLKGIGGEHPTFRKKGMILSIPDAIAYVLEDRYLNGSTDAIVDSHIDLSGKKMCPDCGTELVLQEGCNICPSCAYSKCGG